MENKNIFIVEDDLISAQYLRELLEKDGFRVVDVVDNAEDALVECRGLDVDLVLLDIMLKGQMSGAEAAVKIKQSNPKCKIIFLTAYAEEEMIDYAVDAGVLGYLMKPYREKEILAAVRIALSSHIQESSETDHHFVRLQENFIFDLKKLQLMKNRKIIPLAKKSLRLIEILAKNKNCIVSNEQLCLYIWGEGKENSTLRSLINRFRSKIGVDIIKNVNGLGYMAC